jgi:iron complex transport system substrate-binding protein
MINLTDMAGREVEIPVPAQRVVAIGPGALRLVCYLEATEKVVGVEDLEKQNLTGRPYTLAYPELTQLSSIGPGGPDSSPDAEKLVAVHPDVIFAAYLLDKPKADELQAKTGIPVVVLSYGKLATFDEEVYHSLELMGKILGNEERSQEVVEYLENCRKDLGDRTADIPEDQKPEVYVGGLGRKGSHGIESTQGQYPPFEAINAKNVVDDTGLAGGVSVDKEKLIAWDPDKIFIDASGYPLVKEDYKKNPYFYRSLSAVKQGEVYRQIPYNWYTTNICTSIADAYYAGKVFILTDSRMLTLTRRRMKFTWYSLASRYIPRWPGISAVLKK